MALKNNFEKSEKNFSGTLIANNAYWRVEKISGNKLQCKCSVEIYTEDKKHTLGTKDYYFQPDLNGNNFIAQAYAHLKTLPEFAEAEDC